MIRLVCPWFAVEESGWCSRQEMEPVLGTVVVVVRRRGAVTSANTAALSCLPPQLKFP